MNTVFLFCEKCGAYWKFPPSPLGETEGIVPYNQCQNCQSKSRSAVTSRLKKEMENFYGIPLPVEKFQHFEVTGADMNQLYLKQKALDQEKIKFVTLSHRTKRVLVVWDVIEKSLPQGWNHPKSA